MELSEVKLYLRIDTDAEDSLLQKFMIAADSYLRNAVNDYDKNLKSSDFVAKVDLVKLALIVEMYEKRGVEGSDYSYIIRTFINQLQYWSD